MNTSGSEPLESYMDSILLILFICASLGCERIDTELEALPSFGKGEDRGKTGLGEYPYHSVAF